MADVAIAATRRTALMGRVISAARNNAPQVALWTTPTNLTSRAKLRAALADRVAVAVVSRAGPAGVTAADVA